MWAALLPLAAAEPVSPLHTVHLDVAAGTDFPVSVGAEITAELPSRLRGKIAAGFYPQPYLNLLNDIAIAASWWDDDTAALIDTALSGALVTGASAGWRPWSDRRFAFGAGYQLVALGGGLTDEQALQSVTGIDVSLGSGQSLEATVNAQLHQITIEASWEWPIRERWLLSVQAGALSTLHSNTAIGVALGGPSGPADELAGAAIGTLEAHGESYLDDIFQTWVHTGTIGIYAGYRFF